MFSYYSMSEARTARRHKSGLCEMHHLHDIGSFQVQAFHKTLCRGDESRYICTRIPEHMRSASVRGSRTVEAAQRSCDGLETGSISSRAHQRAPHELIQLESLVKQRQAAAEDVASAEWWGRLSSVTQPWGPVGSAPEIQMLCNEVHRLSDA